MFIEVVNRNTKLPTSINVELIYLFQATLQWTEISSVMGISIQTDESYAMIKAKIDRAKGSLIKES